MSPNVFRSRARRFVSEIRKAQEAVLADHWTENAEADASVADVLWLCDVVDWLNAELDAAVRLTEYGQAETGVDSQPPTRPQGDTSRRKEDATP